MNISVKKTFGAISTAFVVCCGIFVGTASAQDYDSWGEYNSSSTTEMSMPEEPAPGWEPLSDLEEKPASDKSAKAAKTKPAKPAKAPKAAKAPKPVKTAAPKAAPVGGEDRTLNFFANTGVGFGIGAYPVGEVNTLNKSKDYDINMGSGWRLETGVGYMATPNLETRFSLDFNFGLLAPKVEYNDSLNTKYSVYVSWGIKAMAVPQFEVFEMFDMYVGTGLSFNFAHASKDSTFMSAGRNNIKYEMQFDWPAVGLCGVTGVIVPLSDVMDFLGELQFESKSFTLRKLRVTDHTLATDPPDQEYKAGDRDYPSPPKYHGSNWGIRAGLRYWISL